MIESPIENLKSEIPVYSLPRLSIKYLQYYLSASNGKGHGTHSPFLFSFITKVLNDKKKYPAYDNVEDLRRTLLNDNTLLEVNDIGAGSSYKQTNRRTVSSIAKNAAKPKKYGQLLYRIMQFYKPGTILELGTSLGITTSYIASARPDVQIVTIEGVPSVAAKARANFQTTGLDNISVVEGNFDEKLSPVLHLMSTVDFAFIDGNHRKEPTERYFQQLLTKVNNDSILIFDDIHWSGEMEQAWSSIKTHPAVRCSIDLFFIGIVLFRQEFKERQHVSIRF